MSHIKSVDREVPSLVGALSAPYAKYSIIMKGSKIGNNIAVGIRHWKHLRTVTEGAIVASIPDIMKQYTTRMLP